MTERDPFPPLDGLAFASYVRVRFHEVDALGHVNNASYLNYLEQAAIDHAASLGLDMERMERLGGAFVARRHEIDFLRPALAGDLLRVVTWLGEQRGARIDRHYRIERLSEPAPEATFAGMALRGSDVPRDGALLVRATTEWVLVTPAGQPRRIPDEVARILRAVDPRGALPRSS